MIAMAGSAATARQEDALLDLFLHFEVMELVGAELELFNVVDAHQHSDRCYRLKHFVLLLFEC